MTTIFSESNADVTSEHLVWNTLFEQYGTEMATHASKEERTRKGPSLQHGELATFYGIPLQDGSFAYGEITYNALENIMKSKWIDQERIRKLGGVFVDLGSGTGRALFGMALITPHTFVECRGIEILESLAHAADAVNKRWNAWLKKQSQIRQQYHQQSHQQLHQQSHQQSQSQALITSEQAVAADVDTSSSTSISTSKPTPPSHPITYPTINLITGSFLEHDWSDAAVVFATATCFDEALVRAIIAQAQRLKQGTYLITLSKRLTHPSFKLLDSTRYMMSWGYTIVHIHEKITPPCTSTSTSNNDTTISIDADAIRQHDEELDLLLIMDAHS